MKAYPALMELLKDAEFKLKESNYQRNGWGGMTVTLNSKQYPHLIKSKDDQQIQFCFDNKSRLKRIDIN